jgi:hypothetical protein
VLEEANYSPNLRGEGAGQLSGNGEILFTGPVSDELYDKSPSGFYVQSGVRVERRNKGLVIEVGSEEFSIASELIVSALAPHAQGSGLTATLTKNDCLLAIYDSDPLSFPLRVFDRRTGMLRWEVWVWADGGRIDLFGKWNHFASLVVEQNRVLVFGCYVGRVYVEGFDLGDGHNLIRFCTNQIYSF